MLKALSDSHVFGVLPTDYGESLWYACFPIFSQSLIVVVTLPVAKMNDQVCSIHVVIMKVL